AAETLAAPESPCAVCGVPASAQTDFTGAARMGTITDPRSSAMERIAPHRAFSAGRGAWASQFVKKSRSECFIRAFRLALFEELSCAWASSSAACCKNAFACHSERSEESLFDERP